MKLTEWQNAVDQWINKYGVRYFGVMTNTLLLNEEVGEFSRLIARQYGEQSFKSDKTATEVKEDIKDEMGDMIFVITCLANQMNIDLTEILKNNLEKKSKRDHKRHLSNKKLI